MSATIKIKHCNTCGANLPTAEFGVAKWTKDRLRLECNPCRREGRAKYWTRKHGRSMPYSEPEITRSVQVHNEVVLGSVLQADGIEIRGFNTITKEEFKVFYGDSDRVGLKAMTLFNRSGSVFMEWALSGVKDPKAALLEYLKHHHIRLELSDSDVIASKTMIYYV